MATAKKRQIPIEFPSYAPDCHCDICLAARAAQGCPPPPSPRDLDERLAALETWALLAREQNPKLPNLVELLLG